MFILHWYSLDTLLPLPLPNPKAQLLKIQSPEQYPGVELLGKQPSREGADN